MASRPWDMLVLLSAQRGTRPLTLRAGRRFAFLSCQRIANPVLFCAIRRQATGPQAALADWARTPSRLAIGTWLRGVSRRGRGGWSGIAQAIKRSAGRRWTAGDAHQPGRFGQLADDQEERASR
jgi:hypothetical protein